MNTTLARARAQLLRAGVLAPVEPPPPREERPPRPCPICKVGMLQTVLLCRPTPSRDVPAPPLRDPS